MKSIESKLSSYEEKRMCHKCLSMQFWISVIEEAQEEEHEEARTTAGREEEKNLGMLTREKT